MVNLYIMLDTRARVKRSCLLVALNQETFFFLTVTYSGIKPEELFVVQNYLLQIPYFTQFFKVFFISEIEIQNKTFIMGCPYRTFYSDICYKWEFAFTNRSLTVNLFCFFFNFLIGVCLIFNVVLVSEVQQGESVILIYIHISAVFQILFPQTIGKLTMIS